MCYSDRDRYTKEWESEPELSSSVTMEDYIYCREVEEYGLCDDELGTEDNEDY